MWITQKITQPLRETAAENGRAVAFQNLELSTTGSMRQQNVPLYAPAGLSAIPCQGAQVMLLPCAGEPVCTGVRMTNLQNLHPGEIRLFSAGGASLTLKNSGEIELNGLVITKDGAVIARQEKERKEPALGYAAEQSRLGRRPMRQSGSRFGLGRRAAALHDPATSAEGSIPLPAGTRKRPSCPRSAGGTDDTGGLCRACHGACSRGAAPNALYPRMLRFLPL